MRVEAARLVRALCNGSDLTLQTLISCGGLSVLAQFLGAGPRIDGTGSGGSGSGDGPAGGEGAVDGVDDARRLVRIGIDGVLKVFSLQRIRRNDFCKLFLRLGLMPRVMVRGGGERESAGVRDWLLGGGDGGKELVCPWDAVSCTSSRSPSPALTSATHLSGNKTFSDTLKALLPFLPPVCRVGRWWRLTLPPTLTLCATCGETLQNISQRILQIRMLVSLVLLVSLLLHPPPPLPLSPRLRVAAVVTRTPSRVS